MKNKKNKTNRRKSKWTTKKRAFKMIKILGQGSFANVYLVETMKTGQKNNFTQISFLFYEKIIFNFNLKSKTCFESYKIKEQRGNIGTKDYESNKSSKYFVFIWIDLS